MKLSGRQAQLLRLIVNPLQSDPGPFSPPSQAPHRPISGPYSSSYTKESHAPWVLLVLLLPHQECLTPRPHIKIFLIFQESVQRSFFLFKGHSSLCPPDKRIVLLKHAGSTDCLLWGPHHGFLLRIRKTVISSGLFLLTIQGLFFFTFMSSVTFSPLYRQLPSAFVQLQRVK